MVVYKAASRGLPLPYIVCSDIHREGPQFCLISAVVKEIRNITLRIFHNKIYTYQCHFVQIMYTYIILA